MDTVNQSSDNVNLMTAASDAAADDQTIDKGWQNTDDVKHSSQTNNTAQSEAASTKGQVLTETQEAKINITENHTDKSEGAKADTAITGHTEDVPHAVQVSKELAKTVTTVTPMKEELVKTCSEEPMSSTKVSKNDQCCKNMEDQAGLNNLLAAAAAETIGTVQPRSQSSTQFSTAGSKYIPTLSPMMPITGGYMPQPGVAATLQQPQPHFMLGQPQFTTAQAAQPQFFIAGPSQSNGSGLPYQQILIPLNQPPQMQQGGSMPQQYITIPVSLGMGSAQPIQILANPPIMAGLQQFAMIPGHVGATPDSNQSGPGSKSTTDVSVSNGSPMIAPMFFSAPSGATILSTPQLQPQSSAAHSTASQPQQQSDVITSMADINSQIAKFLPSIQSLVTTTMNSHTSVDSQAAGETSSTLETHSPGSNETLVSSTEPGSVIDGIVLDDIKEFAKQFKSRRLSMGLTQTQVGHALSAAEGPAYSQSAICRFEKLDITPKSAQKIKPVLERWLIEAEARHRCGGSSITGSTSTDRSKKRKRRTSFTPQAVEILTEYFLKNTHPSGNEMTVMANKLGYDREVVRVWFCNKRQALKNASKRLKPDTSSTTTDNQSSTPPLL